MPLSHGVGALVPSAITVRLNSNPIPALFSGYLGHAKLIEILNHEN